LVTSASNTVLTDRITQAQCNLCCYFCVVAHAVTVLSAAWYSHIVVASIIITIELITYCSPVLCFLLLWSTGRDGSELLGLYCIKRIIHSIMSC